MSLTLSREIAYDTYVQVMAYKRRPEHVLEEMYAGKGKSLKRLDHNLIKEIVFGGLRWYSKIYWILQKTSNRNLDECSWEVRVALILGTYQIFYMDRIPDRAAVNESVEYVRMKGQSNACSFVNGILRQIARRSEYFTKPDKEKATAEYLAMQFSHPGWIIHRWMREFKLPQVEKMLSSNNIVPPTFARINSMKTPLDKSHELQQSLLKHERTHTDREILRSALRLKEYPNLGEGSLFSEGFYTIQNMASQLIGYLLNPQENETIVDACAGPGGKLSHIYELTHGKANIIAIEKNKHLMQKAQDTMKRLGHLDNVEYISEDFLNWKAKQKVDRILLDAPCSGLGVLRTHPDGRWNKTEAEISKLVQIQKDLIEHALKNIKVGGYLVFSVCSFEREETFDHIARFKEKYGDKLELISPVVNLQDYFKRYVTKDNILLIYSGNQDDMNGFGAFIFKINEEF